MRIRLSIHVIALLSGLLAFSSDAVAGRRVRTATGKKAEETAKTVEKDKDKLKSFAEQTKDKLSVEGLFTFYHDTTDNSWLMAIKPDQFGPIYLCGETRSQAEGAYFDNGSMRRSFPFYLERVGKDVFMMEKNLRIRADTAAALHRAVASGISDHLFASTKVQSKPDDSTGAILVDPADFFICDAQNVGYLSGQQAKTGLSFDKGASYFKHVKSFPQNSEIDVRLHYKTSKPIEAETMQNPYSMFHTYHYSLSTLPETDYVPRLADDRVGYFMTLYQDYTNLDSESPYVRYIERWNLKKKNPTARVSEPVEPIVFWVENTVPEEYRDAVAEGIEFWNPAFEKIGFRNAVVAKQMPDDADWDPADVRYNTIRWIIIPGGGYASGPSRANPFSGQIYDADIRVSVDFIRYMFTNMQNFIKPVSTEALPTGPYNGLSDFLPDTGMYVDYRAESAREAAFGLAYALSVSDDLVDKDSLTREYVHAYVVEMIAHEVGHTLGLRHNYKASTVYSLDQISDPGFTRKNATVGTIMDYAPPNIGGPNRPQGEFYSSVPGPYDNWAIEYGYSELGTRTSLEELPKLKEIASRAAEFDLIYATDEDAFGNSIKSIDPLCNLFDLGDDPLAYCEHKVSLTDELWRNSMDDFEIPGESFQKVLQAFQTGWRSYSESARYATKYIGGIHHNRYHVGDKAGTLPFKPVPAADQRRAMAFLSAKIFAPDAFDLPAALLNKLQPERFPDFSFSVYDIPQVDYPIHATALGIQNLALNRLYSPYILRRLIDNLERYQPSEEPYTMYEMFGDIRRAIWGELDKPEKINSFRRQLQMVHLNRLIQIYLSGMNTFPADARTLAADDLNTLESKIRQALKAPTLDNMTKAHLKEVQRQIEAAKGARRDYSLR
ncbi:MAG: zinc-dependent metalloprotease [candidate division Zixibacteria bacterium]|nr:zinc-dependent metalloprotease [candidate division Zixibacteria bacterium]